MANPSPYGPPPWTDAEKNFLLAELIKQAGPQPLQLLSLLENMNIAHISWGDIPLPTGRTLNEAMNAYAQLRRSAGVPQPPYITPVGLGGGQSPSPMSATAGNKRTYPFDTQGGRALRPKPSPTGNIYGLQFPQIEAPPKKKRGRPTKAEIAARDKAQAMTGESSAGPQMAAQGEVPHLITGAPPLAGEPLDPRPAETSPAEPSPAEQPRPSLPALSRMPISSIITPTAPKTASQSSSSSGKRRRGRSMRAEAEDIPTPSGIGGPVLPAMQEYESPYARIPPQTQSSPTIATSAAMRYREDTVQPTSRQPEQQTQLPPPPPPTTQPQQPPPSSPSIPEYTRST